MYVKIKLNIDTFWRPAKPNHHLYAVPAMNNDLREKANGDGLRRQVKRHIGRRIYSRNHEHGLSKSRPC